MFNCKEGRKQERDRDGAGEREGERGGKGEGKERRGGGEETLIYSGEECQRIYFIR